MKTVLALCLAAGLLTGCASFPRAQHNVATLPASSLEPVRTVCRHPDKSIPVCLKDATGSSGDKCSCMSYQNVARDLFATQPY